MLWTCSKSLLSLIHAHTHLSTTGVLPLSIKNYTERSRCSLAFHLVKGDEIEWLDKMCVYSQQEASCYTNYHDCLWTAGGLHTELSPRQKFIFPTNNPKHHQFLLKWNGINSQMLVINGH